MAKDIDRALTFAYNAHEGQFRKYTKEPYICHPIAVAAILKRHGYTEGCIIAALLHDTVEDTTVTNDDILKSFGFIVAKLVEELTDISKPEDGNRKTRKAIDREHILSASLAGQEIKLADLIDNTKSISTHDKGFAKIYLAEKRLILDGMGSVNPVLLKEANDVWKSAMIAVKESGQPFNAERNSHEEMLFSEGLY